MSTQDDTLRNTAGGAAITIGFLIIIGIVIAFGTTLAMGFASNEGVTIRGVMTFFTFGGVGVFAGVMFIVGGHHILHGDEEESASNGE